MCVVYIRGCFPIDGGANSPEPAVLEYTHVAATYVDRAHEPKSYLSAGYETRKNSCYTKQLFYNNAMHPREQDKSGIPQVSFVLADSPSRCLHLANLCYEVLPGGLHRGSLR